MNTTKPPTRKEFRANFTLSKEQHSLFKELAKKNLRTIGQEIVWNATENTRREGSSK